MKSLSPEELAQLRVRRVAVYEERLRKERLRARNVEAEVMRERSDREAIEREAEAENARRRQAEAYERRMAEQREQTLMDARCRRLEAEEANRIGDEAIWHRNLELRRRYEVEEDQRRRLGRAAKHEEERQRIEPFMRAQRAAKDGHVDNKLLGTGGPSLSALGTGGPQKPKAPSWAQ